MQADFSRRFIAVLAATLVVIGMFSVGVANADELYASIRGVVTDPSGAVLPGVTVTATNVETGISRTVNTKNDGSYNLLNLPVGRYRMVATRQGFKSFAARAIALTVNQIYVQDVRLEVGATSETVEVTASAARVETTSNQLGTVISGNVIQDLPLNGRNWVQLQQLQPGVVASSDRFGSNFATNGSQSQQNSYLINGTDSNDLPLNTPLVIPSPDAIGEFNMITNTINPEYGRNSGAILNAIIKSGTNSFHGSAFEFFRDTSLNTHNFFLLKPDVFHQNQFGATVGGPVWKNHTFFFFSYQGRRTRQAQGSNLTTSTPGNATVFSPAERGGSFGSDLSGSSGTSPFPLVGENGTTYPAGTPYSTIFPTGNIPAADFNSVARNLMTQFVPLPNAPSNQFRFNPVTASKQDQFLWRIDQHFSDKDQLWGYAFLQSTPSVDDLPFTGADLPGFPQQSQSHVKQYTVSWTHVLSPTTLNELRAGFTSLNFVAVTPVKAVLPSSAGFAGIVPQNPAGAGLPTIAVGCTTTCVGNFTLGFTDNGPQPRIDQTYQLTDNFSKVVGRHTLKFGFEGRRFQVANPFFAVNNGHFDFGGNGTYTTGVPAADFLLGIPDDYFQGSGGRIDARAYEYYMYAQDQFKLRSNLTLNYGLAYQIDTPLNDLFNKGVAINCWRPGQQSTVFPSAPVGLVFPGDRSCNSAGYNTKYSHFGPRFGFAYSPNWGWLSGGANKLSIRAGYGVYFNRSEEELTLQNLGTPPFGVTSFGIGDIGGDASFANPFVDLNQSAPGGGVGTVANKFPFAFPAPGSRPDFTQFEPFSISVINPNFSTPYAQNYNLTIERELPSSVILSVAYVASLGRRLIRTIELNPDLNPAACAASARCRRARFNLPASPTANALNLFKYTGSIYGSIGEERTDGISNYNSLQVSAKKSLTHGLTFLLAYTWSHSLDTASGFENSGFGGSRGRGSNPVLPQAVDYSDSIYDARNRFVLSSTYDVPTPFKNNAVLSRVLGGWRFGGILTLQKGFPIGITDSGLHSLVCTGSGISFYACPDSPNQLVSSIPTFDARNTSFVNSVRGGTTSKTNYFFNPNNFAFAPFGTFGNAHRYSLHGPGINNVDFALYKDIRVTEQTRFELRLETFNTFNHTQFRNPNNNINSGNFARVLSARDPRLVQIAAKFYF